MVPPSHTGEYVMHLSNWQPFDYYYFFHNRHTNENISKTFQTNIAFLASAYLDPVLSDCDLWSRIC